MTATSQNPRKAKRQRQDPRCWKCWRRSLWEPRVVGRMKITVEPWVVLEQMMGRSADEQRCVECGAPGTVKVERTAHSLIQSVARYWMCAACDALWKARGAPVEPAPTVYVIYPAGIEVAA